MGAGSRQSQEDSAHQHPVPGYYSIQEQVAEFKNLVVKCVASAANFGDAMIKALPLPTFRALKGIYGLDKI